MSLLDKGIRVGSFIAMMLVLTVPARDAAAQIFGSDPESLKRTDKLIEKAERTVKEAVSARDEIQKTLNAYNAVFKSEDKKVRDAYKAVEKGMERTEKQRETAKLAMDEMKTEADAYFTSWNESLQQIESPDLRKRSETRMAETRGHFDGVFSAVADARAQYEPFLKNLKDQWTYLGHDLNAEGIKSLKPDADKLNAQAVDLFKKIDVGLRKANDYIASLKSSRPIS
jgi:chromosome segregation ATPase